MAKVTFQPGGAILEVEPGTTILEAARKAGIKMESPCNGAGTCGKCRILTNQLQPVEAVLIRKEATAKTNGAAEYILACTSCITSDVAITTEIKQDRTMQILNGGKSFVYKLDSYIRKQYSRTARITEVFAGELAIAEEVGNTEDQNYGIVVDIGTTTLVASLVDLNTGIELQSASALNPQAIHAQDVLSRIRLASEEAGLKVLYTEIIQEINRLIGKTTKGAGVDGKQIYEAVFSGNTCMLHLAAGINPRSLGKYPYTPGIRGGLYLNASEHGLGISDKGVIYLPPIISAYVGADITSGILASQLHKQKQAVLFVDIGTNGEMAVSLEGRLAATSTAAGPAFEGMNISCGMRAGKGAVELFDIGEDGAVTVKTIGESEPSGICGSGLLDVVGELVDHGVIDSKGRFVAPETAGILPSLAERMIQQEGKTVFRVAGNVFLTQKDIRQVQLAKGAVRAGIEFLLESRGLAADGIERVLIAGSFGYHLRAGSLIHIGLLPAEFEGKVEFVGNTSNSGGQAFLLNQGYRSEMEKLVQEVETIELANYKDFDKVFVRCLGF